MLIILHQLIWKLVGILIFNTISHSDLHQFYSIANIHQIMTFKEKEELSKPQNTICTIKCDSYTRWEILWREEGKTMVTNARFMNFFFNRRKRFFTLTLWKESFGWILLNSKFICVIGTLSTYLGKWGERVNFDNTVAEIQQKYERKRKSGREKMHEFR